MKNFWVQFKKYRSAGVLFGIAIVYLWLRWGYLPAGAYWSPDNGYRRLQSDAIRWEGGTLSSDLPYPGQALDPTLAYVPFDDHFYFIHNGDLHLAQWPLMPLLAQPLIRLFGDRGAEIIPMLAGLLCVWFVGKLIQRDQGSAGVGMILAGLLTPLLIYSLVFWEHSVAAMMGLAVLVLVADENPFSRSRGVFLLSGGIAGLAGGVRKEMLLFDAAMAIMLAINAWRVASAHRREAWLKLGLWLAACAVLVGGYGVTSYLKSGQLIPPEFRVSVTPEYGPESYLFTHGLAGVADFIFDEKYGAMGVWLFVGVLAYAWAGYKPTPGREGLQGILLAGLLVGNFRFLLNYSPLGDGFHGILTVSPFLVVGLNRAGWDSRLGRNIFGVAVGFLGLSILSLGLLTKRGANQAELEWGARFMLVFFPLMIPLVMKGLKAIVARTATAGTGWGQWAARLHLGMFALLVIFSALMQFLGLLNVSLSVQNNLELRDKVLALPETHVLTEVWWVAAQVPETYWKKDLFYNADRSWNDWWAQARVHGISQVAYISFAEVDSARLAELAPPGANLRVVDSEWVSGRVFITRLELIEEVPK